jgi:hypothetical protein
MSWRQNENRKKKKEETKEKKLAWAKKQNNFCIENR